MPIAYPELGFIFLDASELNDDYTLSADGAYRNLWGNGDANRLEGNAFNNYINGDGGVDTLIGGQGDDTYRVDQPDDVITELSGEGIDTVWSNVGYTLDANVENLFLDEGGGPDLLGIGNELSNRITGNSGENYLQGLGGNDTLDGGAGADLLEGGTGDDVYVVDNALDGVDELAGEGTDTVVSWINFSIETLTNIENIVLVGGATSATGNEGNNSLTGNGGANQLTAGGGNDILNGAAGADLMDGGLGNDIYYVDDAGDQVVETSAGGLDLVYASVSHTLANFVENLYALGSSSIDLAGNTLDNSIFGNSAANQINGGAGNDHLYGGLGKDLLAGSTGKDIFVLNTKASSSNVDKIVDFVVRDDTIQLDNAIFKKLGSGSEAAPKKLSSSFFNIGTKADDRNDYLIYNNKNGYLYYDADGSGSGKAVLIATLSKNLKMTSSDFYVI